MCLAALAAAESAASAAGASRPLRAAAFTTRVPAGWPVVAFEDDGRIYRLRTPATRFDDGGIQRPGGVAVFIGVYKRAQFGRFYGVDPPRRIDDVSHTFTPPGEATEEFRLFAPRRTAARRRSRPRSPSASPTPPTSRPTSSPATATAGSS